MTAGVGAVGGPVPGAGDDDREGRAELRFLAGSRRPVRVQLNLSGSCLEVTTTSGECAERILAGLLSAFPAGACRAGPARHQRPTA